MLMAKACKISNNTSTRERLKEKKTKNIGESIKKRKGKERMEFKANFKKINLDIVVSQVYIFHYH
ncbi:MAG: hypothetical protein ACTSVI_06615, partial [Promethearchaeota archaeon]